jgi:hypothetical protein
MDWTYSPFIAAYFAFEYAQDADNENSKKCEKENKQHTVFPAIWCLNTDWCKKKIKLNSGLEQYIKAREEEEPRSDKTFIPLYMDNPLAFIYPENPFLLHTRLAKQYGVFLCPGCVSTPLDENLKALDKDKDYVGSDDLIKDSVYEIRCELDREERLETLRLLNRMNINRALLFPGLDGFAKSMTYRFRFYQELGQDRGINKT